MEDVDLLIMSWRNRRRLWLRRVWNLCRPRHSLPAVVGRVRVAATTGHIVGAHRLLDATPNS